MAISFNFENKELIFLHVAEREVMMLLHFKKKCRTEKRTDVAFNTKFEFIL